MAAYNRAEASEAVEAVLATLAEAYEVDRNAVEVEEVTVVFTDNEGHVTRHVAKSAVEVSPDATADAKANAETFKAAVAEKAPPTSKEK